LLTSSRVMRSDPARLAMTFLHRGLASHFKQSALIPFPGSR
jgi:hypothetical protein